MFFGNSSLAGSDVFETLAIVSQDDPRVPRNVIEKMLAGLIAFPVSARGKRGKFIFIRLEMLIEDLKRLGSASFR